MRVTWWGNSAVPVSVVQEKVYPVQALSDLEAYVRRVQFGMHVQFIDGLYFRRFEARCLALRMHFSLETIF